MKKTVRNAAAQEIAASLKKHPDMEVDHLAVEHGLSHDDVVEILDEYRVIDGKAQLVGPGGGGGWSEQ